MMEDSELCFPQLNSSCRKPHRSHSDALLVYIVLSFISVLTVTLNLMVIISISHFKQLHTPTNLLLLSLAVTDFFVGLLLSFQIVLIDGCWFLGEYMCAVYYVVNYIITSVSIGNMVLISVDRYVAICCPLHYPTKVTVRAVSIYISLCWICSFLYSSLLSIDLLKQPGRDISCYGECVVVISYFAGLADLILSFICPVTVIIVLYTRVFAVAVSQARAMRSHITVVSLQQPVKVTVKKSELKAARTLGVVIVVFLFCLSPYFCVTLTDNMLNASAAAFIISLFYFNSCVNPLIYACFYPWFRKSVKLIVTLQILKPGSCETNML